MGVSSESQLSVVAEAMARLGVRHAFVAHGSDGLDEITVSGETSLAEVRRGRAHGSEFGARQDGEAGSTVRLFRMTPEDAGLARASLAELAGSDTAAGNAAILERIFAGETGPRRDIVLLNAAAALVAAGLATDFVDGIARGAAAIDSGAAWGTVERLREFGQGM
jgi:anthranilate phosphoribosyltransferase